MVFVLNLLLLQLNNLDNPILDLLMWIQECKCMHILLKVEHNPIIIAHRSNTSRFCVTYDLLYYFFMYIGIMHNTIVHNIHKKVVRKIISYVHVYNYVHTVEVHFMDYMHVITVISLRLSLYLIFHHFDVKFYGYVGNLLTCTYNLHWLCDPSWLL